MTDSESVTDREVDAVIDAVTKGEWTTADLVRLAHAVSSFGKNGTSVLGQYGEELVAKAFGGTVAGFETKAYDVRTPENGDLQVKTFSAGKRPGNIRSFTHDVVALAIDPSTARVVSARLYSAADLFGAFQVKYASNYAPRGMAWGGAQTDRFERGWTIPPGLPSRDITHMFW